jgi:hypothetical protein
MDDALIQTKHRFAQEFVISRKLDIEPLIADRGSQLACCKNPSVAVKLRRRSEPR